MLDYEGLLAASDVFSVLPQMFEQWLDSRARPGETRNSRESRRDRARVESLDHRCSELDSDSIPLALPRLGLASKSKSLPRSSVVWTPL